MDLDLGGRHVLVTGGSKGIGLACAQEFCREGARVTIVARSREGMDAALGQLKAQGFACHAVAADLADADAAARSSTSSAPAARWPGRRTWPADRRTRR